MNVIILSIDHDLQLLENETDPEALRGFKSRLREILEAQLAGGRVAGIFEESSPRKESNRRPTCQSIPSPSPVAQHQHDRG